MNSKQPIGLNPQQAEAIGCGHAAPLSSEHITGSSIGTESNKMYDSQAEEQSETSHDAIAVKPSQADDENES